jgi:hypothetical protein
MISNQETEVLDGLELLSLEDVGFCQRVRNQVLSSKQTNLRVWVGNEAHKLRRVLIS